MPLISSPMHNAPKGVSLSPVAFHPCLKCLETSPKLAVGDGALGFWNAMAKHYPSCKHQRCWGFSCFSFD